MPQLSSCKALFKGLKESTLKTQELKLNASVDWPSARTACKGDKDTRVLGTNWLQDSWAHLHDSIRKSARASVSFTEGWLSQQVSLNKGQLKSFFCHSHHAPEQKLKLTLLLGSAEKWVFEESQSPTGEVCTQSLGPQRLDSCKSGKVWGQEH